MRKLSESINGRYRNFVGKERHVDFSLYIVIFFFYIAGAVLLLSCVILIGLFALQHTGTQRVAIVFAPIVIIWLISIFGIGLYNIIHWNPKIVNALSPHYIIKFFRKTGSAGWLSLGGVLLSVTGIEILILNVSCVQN